MRRISAYQGAVSNRAFFNYTIIQFYMLIGFASVNLDHPLTAWSSCGRAVLCFHDDFSIFHLLLIGCHFPWVPPLFGRLSWLVRIRGLVATFGSILVQIELTSFFYRGMGDTESVTEIVLIIGKHEGASAIFNSIDSECSFRHAPGMFACWYILQRSRREFNRLTFNSLHTGWLSSRECGFNSFYFWFFALFLLSLISSYISIVSAGSWRSSIWPNCSVWFWCPLRSGRSR